MDYADIRNTDIRVRMPSVVADLHGYGYRFFSHGYPHRGYGYPYGFICDKLCVVRAVYLIQKEAIRTHPLFSHQLGYGPVWNILQHDDCTMRSETVLKTNGSPLTH